MGQAGKWPSARTPCFPQPYPKTRPLSGDRRGEAKTSFTAGGNILHGQMQIFSGTSGQAEGKNKSSSPGHSLSWVEGTSSRTMLRLVQVRTRGPDTFLARGRGSAFEWSFDKYFSP
ncbi:hypothetical protein KM043_004536 [Ampulex compressa]|nr:hypothetical protein KM043_004536 [Ampulex compressa]